MKEIKDSLFSDLQARILRITCTMKDVDYATLMKQTNRDRVTILQSIESLIRRHYIEKEKLNPEYEKSKLVFRPTFLGKHSAWSLLGVSVEDIFNIEEDEQIINYMEFIKDISETSQREKLLAPLSDFLTLYAAWKDKGKIDPTLVREILRDGLKKGILELVQDKNYDAKNILNKRSTDLFKKLFTYQEIEDFRQFILQVIDNLTSTVKRLPT